MDSFTNEIATLASQKMTGDQGNTRSVFLIIGMLSLNFENNNNKLYNLLLLFSKLSDNIPIIRKTLLVFPWSPVIFCDANVAISFVKLSISSKNKTEILVKYQMRMIT